MACISVAGCQIFFNGNISYINCCFLIFLQYHDHFSGVIDDLSSIHRLTCVSLQHEFLLFQNSGPRLLYGDNNSRRYCIAYNRDSRVVNEKNRK
jgi:hypothetical protein